MFFHSILFLRLKKGLIKKCYFLFSYTRNFKAILSADRIPYNNPVIIIIIDVKKNRLKSSTFTGKIYF